MVDWYLGTMGFGWDDWDGIFYPLGLDRRERLEYYAYYFNAVEMDSTFYAIPPVEYVDRWNRVTPDDFVFCPKMPREITHELALVETADLVEAFLQTMRRLDDKLGAILIQFPPRFDAGNTRRLDSFLDTLTDDLRFAVEFRHKSWFTPATADLLAGHGVAWIAADYADMPKQVLRTTDFLFLRWLGEHGRFQQKDHVRIDVRPRLEWWWERVEPHLDTVDTVYGFANNDYAGYSPETIDVFKEIAGLPTGLPDHPQQDALF